MEMDMEVVHIIFDASMIVLLCVAVRLLKKPERMMEEEDEEMRYVRERSPETDYDS